MGCITNQLEFAAVASRTLGRYRREKELPHNKPTGQLRGTVVVVVVDSWKPCKPK
jgi:hypothetical protein